MKKYFLLLAAAAAIFAVSCQREQTKESENPTQTVIDDSVPMPILFGSSMPQVKAPETKGVGGIDAWRAALQQPLYVYAMERNGDDHVASKWTVDPNDPSLDEFTPFIDNVAAQAPATNSALDATGHSRDAINVYNKYVTATNEPYYYVEGKVYDFYGYYVDDAMGIDANNNNAVIEPAPEINAGTALSAEGEVISSIVLNGLTLDGSQDIMLAQTNKDDDWALRTEYVSLDMIYSSRAARRGVIPDLVFKHELSRFEFHIFNGSATIGNNDITVTGLNLASYTKDETGNLTIYPEATAGYVADDLATAFDPAAPDYTILKYFPLREETATLDTGDPVDDAHPASLTAGVAVVDGTNKVGESIMIAAGEASYDIQLFINQTGVTAPGFNPAEQHLTIDMSQVKDANGDLIGATVSEKGKKYVVSLIIYGLEQIEVTVTLTDWEDGGTIEIDPDQDPNDNRVEAEITVTEQSLEVREGAKLFLGTDYHVTSNNVYSKFEFASEDASIFTVDADGTITGVQPGTANLIINQPQSVSHLAADEVTIPVTVTADQRPLLTITAADITMPLLDSKGYYSTKRFRETIAEVDADPTLVIGEKTYVSADPAVATVDAKTGVITAVAEGTTTVTLTVAETNEYKETTCTINVEITVARTNTVITVADQDVNDGDQVVYTITAGYDGVLEFTSGDDTIFTVDGNGVITKVAAGTTTLTIHAPQTANFTEATETVNITVL